MKRALSLAKRAEGRTSPNPMVGSVLVKGGKIIAEDYHRKPGNPHAEALVLASAGEKARGGTLYVTLEPCCHTAKRTPPCTKAIIASGVKRVVAAMDDPNPKVSGKGFDELREAGIEVVSGVLESEARALNEFYIKFITTGRPYVIMKVAMTLDGKIAGPAGESKWITGEKSRKLVHKMRSRVDAVLTAIGTVKADNPSLTARIRGGRDPIRVVIDPRFETPRNYNVMKCPPPTVIVTKAPDYVIKKHENSGIIPFIYKESLELPWLMDKLGEMGITSVMIEAGSSLTGRALNEGIVDRVMFFIAPKMIGGRASYTAVGGPDFRTLEEAFRVKDMKVRKIGDDLLIEGDVEG